MNITKMFSGLILLLLVLSSMGFANATTQISSAICDLYNTVNTVLGAVIFLLIILAAVVYAAGQVMGAETRARASVWATSMLVGAIIGVLIIVLVPHILELMLGQTLSACGTNNQSPPPSDDSSTKLPLPPRFPFQ